jgi:hypothetical protein
MAKDALSATRHSAPLSSLARQARDRTRTAHTIPDVLVAVEVGDFLVFAALNKLEVGHAARLII